MLSWIGGKSRIGDWIVKYYPKDIETYVEPMAGMMWCFFNMNLSEFPFLKKVVYNDMNSLNYNLFQCAQNPSELQKALDNIPVQEFKVSTTPSHFKEKFDEFQKEIFSENFKPSQYDYESAAKYAYVVTQVFSGSKPDKSQFIDLKGKYRSKYLSFRDKLTKPEWIEHFLKITDVENLDFAEVFTKYDSENTYFYCDPPYFSTENYYSNHDFGRTDHERFANSIKNIAGKFSISYYDFPQLHEWFPENLYKWEKKQFAKAAGAIKGRKQTIGEELLILNY